MAQPPPPPFRVILELTPDGTITAEYYSHNEPQKTTINQFDILPTISSIFASMQEERTRLTEQSIKILAATVLARHRRIWLKVAAGYDGNAGFGQYFANKTVGNRNSLTLPVKEMQASEYTDVEDLL